MPRARSKGNSIAYHLAELGAGSAEAAIRYKRRHPTHRVAAVDRGYRDRNLGASPIPVLEKYNLHVSPKTYREFFREVIQSKKRIPKLVLDMPWMKYPDNNKVSDSSLREKRFEAQLRGVV